MSDVDPTLERLDNQIDWYDRKSIYNQRMFKWFKGIEVVTAAMIAFSASLELRPSVTAAFGAAILILEGFQHLNQYQSNWISYRSTCEALRHEKYLYLAKAGPYETAANADVLLAERIESQISQEHAKWVSGREESSRKKKVGGPASK